MQLQLHKSLVNSGNHLQPLVELPSGSTPPARRLHHQGARETRDVARRRGGADGDIDFVWGERKQLIQKQKSSENLGEFFCLPQKSWRIPQSSPTLGQVLGWITLTVVDRFVNFDGGVQAAVGCTMDQFASCWWLEFVCRDCWNLQPCWQLVASEVDSPSLIATFTNKPYGMVNCDKTLVSFSWFWIDKITKTFPLQIVQSSFTAFGPKCIKQSATPCSARQKGRRCKASLSSSRTWKRSRNQTFLNPGSEKVSSFTWPRNPRNPMRKHTWQPGCNGDRQLGGSKGRVFWITWLLECKKKEGCSI